MAKVVLTRRAAKDLEELDSQTKRRILEKLQMNAANPLQQSVKLTASKLGTYRYRVGDYRIIFDLEGDILTVLRVGHRREIYL
ncbi:MAG TPA: type II toxin-antitoxin system RelE/ParE family toxin [Thermoanaerobaculia bacterium]|nr:type II toxin-antitoxin system RelE/ParE family toxin [Thermoanaerobaculia bacterium]